MTTLPTPHYARSAATAALFSMLTTSSFVWATSPTPPPQICIDNQNCATTPTSSGKAGVKWHPGHYAETQSYGSIPAAAIRDIATIAAVEGVTQRYYWSTIEPVRGQYDFSAIKADLEKLRPYNKRLIALIMDRSWRGTDTTNLPAYLVTEPGSNHGIFVSPRGGVRARIWNPVVMDRLIALSAALAGQFDDEPLFEGIRFEEITSGMTPGSAAAPADLTTDGLITQWNRLAAAAKSQWKHTNVFFNTNTLGGITGPLRIIEHAYQIGGIGVGGPDVLPPGAGAYKIAGDRVITRSPNAAKGDVASQFVRDYRGSLPICHSVQTPELGGKKGTFTPQELADYIIQDVRETHMSWVIAPATSAVSWAGDIRPYLTGNPRQTVQSCPTQYAAGCNTN